MSPVAVLFAKYVNRGVYKIEQIPPAWKSQVEEILENEKREEDARQEESLSSDPGADADHRSTESNDPEVDKPND